MAQELSTKMMEKLPEGSDLVRPYETEKAYWTEKATKGNHVKAGDEFEGHPLFIAKLVKSGKATKEAPSKAAKK